LAADAIHCAEEGLSRAKLPEEQHMPSTSSLEPITLRAAMPTRKKSTSITTTASPRRVLQSGQSSKGLTEAPREPEKSDPMVMTPCFENSLFRLIRRWIQGKDDLKGFSQIGKDRHNPPKKFLDVALLFVYRNNDTDLYVGLHEQKAAL
jgi:hypothetical protein